MPSTSIDTFFACVLMVSVVLVSIALSTGILTSHMNNLQDLKEEEYFQAISENILSSYGVPADWGSSETTTPETFGLARAGSLYPNELDVDKISRLNSENAFSLTYQTILNSARLKNIAFGLSVSQLMDVSIKPISNNTSENSTSYTFRVHVTTDGTPVPTSLHYYVIARDFLSNASGSTSDNGTSDVNIEIPNTSNGTASLIVFARASYDSRITAFEVYSFGHLSPEPLPNGTFLNLSPLNCTLSISPKSSNITLGQCRAFSYAYQFNLTSTSNETYAISTIMENSPTLLAESGSNGSDFFIEWTSYPQIPLNAGSNFQDSECHSLSYVVTIKKTLYELTLRFGGISQ